MSSAPVDAPLRVAIDTIPGLVWSALPDGYVDFLNQRCCDYTGLSMEEASGWGWQPAVMPEDLPRLLNVWREVIASGEPVKWRRACGGTTACTAGSSSAPCRIGMRTAAS
jgi:PAS domain-containing protein